MPCHLAKGAGRAKRLANICRCQTPRIQRHSQQKKFEYKDILLAKVPLLLPRATDSSFLEAQEETSDSVDQLVPSCSLELGFQV